MITFVRRPFSGRHETRSAKPGPPKEPPKPAPPSPPSWPLWLLPIAIAITVFLLLARGLSTGPQATSIAYSDFVTDVNAGKVADVRIDDTGAVQGTLKGGKTFVTRIPTALNNTQLEGQLRAKGVKHVATVGFCLGGKLGPLSLARGGGEAAVGFYGVGLEKVPDALRAIRHPVQMHYGDADTHIPASAVAAVEEATKGMGNFQVLHYPTGGHGFFRPDLKNEESQVSYKRMLEFLDRAF